MFHAEIKAGFIRKIGERFLFFIIDKTAVKGYLVGLCAGVGEKVGPAESAGACLAEQTYSVK